MKTKMPANAIACAPGALPGGPVRTRFFDGMFLTQADLENEQRYWRLKRRLTNRALGEGVVWGLRLDVDVERQRLALSPGYALDCCGNDLVVECAVTTTMSELWTRADPSLRADAVVITHGEDHEREPNADRGERSACVVLQYTECPEDARPVHRDACGGPTTACETSRIRESARLLLVPPPAAPPLTPPEQFLADLEKWKNELPADVRDALFPTPATPGPTASGQRVPVHVTVTIPGAPAALRTVDFLTSGTTPALATLSAVQTPTAGRRTGVVAFELTTDAALRFTGGEVRDQGRTVEAVTPPAAPSVYWSLDVALPAGVQSTSVAFGFDVDDLQLAGAFGSEAGGRLTGRITGAASVTDGGNGTVVVAVEKLQLETASADGFDPVGQPGCLRELVPWGWTVAPEHGAAIGKTLLLTGLYGFLAEMLARNPGDPRWQMIARVIDALAWRALFGANLAAGQPVTDAHRRALVELIVDLLERWCAGFFYPGPRCADEHHGVYLGCAVLDRANRIVSFDPWQHRRHVLTGPLLTHWAAQVGIAPLDVIVGRFAGAMCCLAGLPTAAFGPAPDLGLAGLGGRGGRGVAGPISRVHVGDATTTTDYAERLGADVRWLSLPMLAARATEAFTAPAGRASEVIATAIPGGGVVALAVPVREDAGGRVVREELAGLLRRGEYRVRPSGRPLVTEFVVDVLTAAPAVAVLHDDTSEPARKLAERAARAGVSAADLIEDGTGALIRRLKLEPREHEAAAELVDVAESTVDFMAATTVKVVGPSVERATFADEGVRKRLAEAISGEVLKLGEQVIDRAAARVGRPR